MILCSDSLASSILLDRRMALVAFFRVGRDPIGSLAVVTALFEPDFGDFADDWSVVRREATSDTRHAGQTKSANHYEQTQGRSN